MPHPSPFTRRKFLRRSAQGVFATGLALGVPDLFLNRTRAATGQNPSGFIRVGFIGVGGQGNHNLGQLMKNAVAVCDVDKTHLEKARDRVNKSTGRSCAAFGDYRKLLEDKSIDAVVISTPDHWHTLASIHACQAGKDVYCEKPMTLFIAEGLVLIRAVREGKRVFQTGSQQRSDENFRKACEYVRAGRIGKIKTIQVGLPGPNWVKKGNAQNVPDGQPPSELDYDQWLGPAPRRAYNQNRVHYLFRFFWDYAGGQMTNWGAHHIDIAQWGLGMDDGGPIEAKGSAVFNQEKLFETPEKFDVTYKYPNGAIMECSSGTGKFKGGTTFIGDKGTIYVSRGKLECAPEEILKQPLEEKDVRLYVSDNHHQNWLDCIKSRKDPICKVEIGHRSATICHLGNIAIRTGKKVSWDPAKQEIVGDAELARWTSRPYREPWRLSTG